jgi:hypothetical protein
MDACQVGGEGRTAVFDKEFIENVYELARGFALLAASTSEQVAQEGQQEHGVFTYYLIDGLRGEADRDRKGFVTVDDLKNHVLDRVREWTCLRNVPIQKPTYRIEGYGDMILADYREKT